MPKIILEKADIFRMIIKHYPGAEIVSGLSEEDIVIRVSEEQSMKQLSPAEPSSGGTYVTASGKVIEIPQEHRPKEDIILPDGSLDADSSGLTLKNREETVPGGAMGKRRGNLPLF